MSACTITLNFNCNYGFVEYDLDTKKASVKLAVAEAKDAVEKFLRTPITLDVPKGDTLREFGTLTLEPLASVEAFKTALTRLWDKTGVRVEWSIPPGMMEKL